MDAARCVTAGEGRRGDYETTTMVAHALRGRSNATHREDSDTYIPVAHALRGEGFDASEDGTGCGTPIVALAIGTDCYNGAVTGDVAATIGTPGSSVNASGPTVMEAMPVVQAIAIQERAVSENPDNGPQGKGYSETGEAFTLGARNRVQAVAVRGREGGATAEMGDESVAFALRTGSGGSSKPHAMQAMQVRRLTPRECERLQGFPDAWTLVTYRGKPAKDGPRYKAIGNSMAVNCMEWIGERIAGVEASL